MNIICVFMVAGCLACHYAPAAEFYVAPTGNDANSGKKDEPFATLDRARDEIRRLHPREGATVSVRGGTYFLKETLVFTPADSGTKDCPVVYAAAPGEKPVISGGMPISGWRQEGKLLITTVPAVKEGRFCFKSLFVNGERATRARAPNDGFFRVRGMFDPELKEGVRNKKSAVPSHYLGFYFHDGDIREWRNSKDAVIVLYHCWDAGLHWIDRVDAAQRSVHFTNRSTYPIESWKQYDPRGQRYYIENVAEALDAPGEWYLDRQTGVLSYYPRPGEHAGNLDAVAGVLERIVELRGDPATGQIVRHVTFKGLTFAHTDWDVADTGRSVRSWATQANIKVQAAAFFAVGAANCAIEDCEVVHGSTHGIWLADGCKDNRVVRCQVHDMGGGGVYIGNLGPCPRETTFGKWLEAPRATDPKDTPDGVTDNVVDNCFIHDLNHVFHGSIGVWLGTASFTTVSRNEICDLDYSGISVGWDWSKRSPPVAQGNLIEGNHVHHIGYGELSDMGGIYVLGRQPGTVLRGNIIHDVNDCFANGYGIYLDASSSEFLIEKNVVYDTGDECLNQNQEPEHNIVRNNVFAFPGSGNIHRGQENGVGESPMLEHNILVGRNGVPFTRNWKRSETFRSDRNLFWDYQHPPADLLFGGFSLAEWRQRGHDVHSVIADPRFEDAARRDFRLKPDSPALALGFEPIDTARCGLYGDEAWVKLPKRTTFRAVFPEALPPQGRPNFKVISGSFADDFESTPAGQPPRAGQVRESEDTGTIRVAADAGRDGKAGLVFTGKPAHSASLFYEVAWPNGTAMLEFDLLQGIGPGVTLVNEWRDWFERVIVAGPIIRVDPKGRLLVGAKELAILPAGKWARVKITCQLGDRADGTFELQLAIEGEQPRTFTALPCAKGKAFQRVSSIGFLCHGQGTASIHLDNLQFTLSEVP